MFYAKNLMLTTSFSGFVFQSIMLTTGFSEKYSGTFFYYIFFWTFLKMSIFEKNIFKFQIMFSIYIFRYTTTSLAIAFITLG
jgi:hypothetical protein